MTNNDPIKATKGPNSASGRIPSEMDRDPTLAQFAQQAVRDAKLRTQNPRQKFEQDFRRAYEKIEESLFFLDQMESYGLQQREFGYCLSAFLSAFKSIGDTLRNSPGNRQAKKSVEMAVRSFRESNPKVNFLMKQRDVEVHREGVGILMTWVPTVEIERFRSRFAPREPRWAQIRKSIRGSEPKMEWRFAAVHSPDLITYCRECVNAIRHFVDSLGANVPSE